VRVQRLRLQTLCLTDGPRRRVVAPRSRTAGRSRGATGRDPCVDADGKACTLQGRFHGQAVNAGRTALWCRGGPANSPSSDKTGNQIGVTAELPFVAELLKGPRRLGEGRSATEAAAGTVARAIGDAKKQFTEQIKKLEDKKKEDRTKTRSRQLDQFKSWSNSTTRWKRNSRSGRSMTC